MKRWKECRIKQKHTDDKIETEVIFTSIPCKYTNSAINLSVVQITLSINFYISQPFVRDGDNITENDYNNKIENPLIMSTPLRFFIHHHP